MNNVSKLSTEKYWSDHWENRPLPVEFDINDKSVSNENFLQVHQYYQSIFISSSGKKIIEVGCGDSVYLPYFHKAFGLEVTGIDYTDIGCKRAEQILSNAGVKGTIIKADLFDLPENLLHQFDFVYSGGVIEHFEDTSHAIAQLKKLLKPGGYIITSLPNITGFNFFVLKYLNREVYDIHKIFTQQEFIHFHTQNDLIFQSIFYYPISFYIVTDGKKGISKFIILLFNKLFYIVGNFFSYLTNLSKKKIIFPYLQSGYILCVKSN